MEITTRIDSAEVGLAHIASGKVREIFELDADTFLFVATDRISAFDVVLANGIPAKGAILTQLSAHWFELIRTRLPSLRTHLLSTSLPPTLPEYAARLLAKRTMQVRRLKIIPLESIVRGYIAGSAWVEYRKHGTIHGMTAPRGLEESMKLPAPMWTPSTKAEAGEHDVNISEDKAVELVGADVAQKVKQASLSVYQMAHDYAAERGIIIADTKFEFGLDSATGEVVLVDEVLTPDSSRFWPADTYAIGKIQASFDKQYLRDWLAGVRLKGKESVEMPSEVVLETAEKYREAYEKLTGKAWVS